MRRLIINTTHTLLTVGLLTACSGTPTKTPENTERTTGNNSVNRPAFPDWRASFRSEALSKGIRADVFDAAMAGIAPQPKVIKADKNQAETIEPMWQYLGKRVSATRVGKGTERFEALTPLLAAIEKEYGVEPTILLGIWGMETNYGSYTGNHYVVEALATLAWEGRRGAYFSGELLNALRILQNGDITRDRFIGSWAGAMGQPQFMPASYLRTAVDFDGDGKRDIWTSEADTLASIAAYLKNAGWKPGVMPAVEVRLPLKFDLLLADGGQKKTVAEWQQLGVRSTGNPLPPANQMVTVELPTGLRGPAFIVTPNLQAIKRYNNSTKYALAVTLIAQQIRGERPIIATWPTDEPGLTREDIRRLQSALTRFGYDAGGADGRPGPATRRAIRAFQADRNLYPDGFPTQNLMRLMGLAIDKPVIPGKPR